MDRPDYPQDDKPGTTNSVPALIHDYRAQREAWREQARNLARMREEVLAAADREAKDIVTSARADVRRILLKARRDLLVLAAQVRAAGRLGEPDDSPDTVNFLPADDLSDISTSLTTARHDVRRVLDETRPELEGLAAEGEALRSALHPHRPGEPRQVGRPIPVLQDLTVERSNQPPVDFEFTSIATDDPEEPFVRLGYPMRTMVVAAASVGAMLLMGTAWWAYRSPGEKRASAVTDSKTAGAKVAGAANAAAGRSRNVVDAKVPGTPVIVTARRTSWVRVTVDGRIAVERTFKAGETEQVRGTREVSVRAGDAGAVSVSVDGRQPVTLGDEGEVMTRRFTLEAAAPQTPRPAPPTTSPSAPQVANSTLRPAAVAPSPAVAPSVPPKSISSLPSPPPRAADLTPAPVPMPMPVIPTTPAATATAGRPATVAAGPPAPSVPAPSGSKTLQSSLQTEAARYLDAYYRQDRATMASISGQVNVSDDRAEKEKLPRGLAGVRRSLDDVSVQVFGSEAMLTAKMTERMDDVAAGRMAEAVSFVSHMWTQKNGVWQLYDVRIVSASALSRAVPR
jgi:uncharacterized protein DUF4115